MNSENTIATTERTILVVEDEAGLRALIEEVLSSEGYTVLMAQDGAGAVCLSEQYPSVIHLLLTDLTLPGMNGQEIAARLTARRPDMQVLFMSGHGITDIAANGTLEAHWEFIQKPWAPRSLCERIQRMLSPRTAPANP